MEKDDLGVVRFVGDIDLHVLWVIESIRYEMGSHKCLTLCPEALAALCSLPFYRSNSTARTRSHPGPPCSFSMKGAFVATCDLFRVTRSHQQSANSNIDEAQPATGTSPETTHLLYPPHATTIISLPHNNSSSTITSSSKEVSPLTMPSIGESTPRKTHVRPQNSTEEPRFRPSGSGQHLRFSPTQLYERGTR
jgi:hypothetical protein